MIFRFPHSYGEDVYGLNHGTPALEAAVRNALASAYDVESQDITVSTLGAYVILEGFVSRNSDLERAIEIAEDVAGVGAVRNRILQR